MPTNLYRFSLFAASLLIAFLGTLSPAHARRASKDSGSSTTVVIDAGHGGYDRGGIPGQRVAEKEMTLDVAQRLKKVLAASGYRVVMTRDSDVFVPLGTRVAISNSYANAIFVSVHFNSATRSGASGIETYFYDRESLPLASAIHYYVAGGAASSNRNVRRRGYYVLRKNSNPAVLVECGFLTNPSEAALRTKRFLSSKARRRNCSRRPRPQFRDEREDDDTGRDERKHSVATVHRPNQSGEIKEPPVQAFAQKKHATEEELIKTGRVRGKSGLKRSGGIIEPSNPDLGADASDGRDCFRAWRRC